MALLSDPVHFSTLKHIARSPAHYKAQLEQPREPSPQMRFGSIVHAVLLGGEYVIWHGKSRNSNEWKDFAVAHSGQLIATADEYERALWCCDSLGGSRDATRLLVGQHEVSREWELLGRKCAGRLDVLGEGFVTEFKTASSTHPETFVRASLRMGYHAQLAWYLDGIGHGDWPAYVVAVETERPWAVTCFEVTARALTEGRKLARLWLETLRTCEAANEWPAYCQSVVPFDVPEYDEPLLIDGEEVAA